MIRGEWGSGGVRPRRVLTRDEGGEAVLAG